MRAGLNFIRLATPTTDDKRLPKVLQNTSGFVYYVSILKRHTDLPVAVGFGIKTPEQAALICESADAAVVGTAIVNRVKDGLDADSKPAPDLARKVLAYVGELAAGVRGARRRESA